MTHRTTHLSTDTERLIERQLRNWELSRSQQAEKPSLVKTVHEFVAISRQVGSGGSEVAHELATRLGWPVFDKEILHTMASDDAYRERLYESMDERDMGWLEQLMNAMMQGRFVLDDYFHALSRTTLALARCAPAVFLGRAADLILPAESGLRVRIVAPLQFRLNRIATMEHIGKSAAREKVARIDRERADFIRNHFHRDIDESTRCDLTINMARLKPSEAVEIIWGLLAKRGVAK